ncbi:ABC transporter substrate-binding protein [Acidisphaera sp. L21]|uniref:ABC transporter substrate-binding protein n=1 Tax=Acidisphaera sp. L21 TaxID=1641851 RepID=UPI00131CAE7B|nr:ABC transporter substrate-binding protein [Acidisphaera sp. L21]
MLRRTLLKTAAASVLAAPAIAQPAKIPTLRFVPQANLTALDPIFTTAIVTGNHANYVFDTLYSNPMDGQPRPQMAEGHEVSADGRVWRIRLREGLKFHDNTPVRAADCVASIQRWAKRDGFGQLIAKVVDTWGAPDDRTIELKLTRPFPLLATGLGKPDSSAAFMMPERLAKTDANAQITEMVGSGPYKFLAKEYNSGSHMAYEKFDGYVPRTEAPDWGTGAKIAHFQRVEWNIIPDPATAAAALRNGEIDWWEQPINDLLPSLARDKSISLMVSNPQGNESLMRMNCLQAPFNDVAIRRAVLMGVNQEDYMRATFGDDQSLWRTCRSEFPCGTAYETLDDGTLMKGDLKAATAALKASSYAGQRVVLLSPSDFPAIAPLCQVTADLMQKMGFNVDFQSMDWGTVIQRRANMEGVDKGGWSVFHTFGSSGGYSSPATSTLVRGQGKAGWFGWWTSDKAEELTQDWLAAPDAAGQKRVASEIARLAMTEVATVPLGINFTKTAYRNSITGVLQGVAPYPWNVRPA